MNLISQSCCNIEGQRPTNVAADSIVGDYTQTCFETAINRPRANTVIRESFSYFNFSLIRMSNLYHGIFFQNY